MCIHCLIKYELSFNNKKFSSILTIHEAKNGWARIYGISNFPNTLKHLTSFMTLPCDVRSAMGAANLLSKKHHALNGVPMEKWQKIGEKRVPVDANLQRRKSSTENSRRGRERVSADTCGWFPS